ncbi:MAG: L-aspartate oxidase [Planctomycetota bacterium]|jgi:L-aspartate oxidase
MIYPTLTSIDPDHLLALNRNVVVLGSGIAGLSAALTAAETTKVLIITKTNLNNTTTSRAQGGIAAALREETICSHCEDTMNAGVGLCSSERVEYLVSKGVERVQELIQQKVAFDTTDGQIALTMEGGHSERRILHANGDATGRAIQERLGELAVAHPNIEILEHHFAIDLLHSQGCCYGVICRDTRLNRELRINANAVIVATGGLGQVYRETTNPPEATGDGFAMCLRAGATLMDMEFVQFHPTTLYLAGAPRFLISEAVRGEGAHLLTLDGQRFMEEFHPRAELAPRDVVSQAILQVLERTQTNHVVLDLTHIDTDHVRRRFPSIGRLCAEYGIDITRDPIPVRPAVHYMMGGVKTDEIGRTNIQRLYACGEVACTGVHGANRLASNSLLEGLVFGVEAGRHAASCGQPLIPYQSEERLVPTHKGLELDLQDMQRSLRSLTWRCLGAYREKHSLEEARETIQFWEQYILRDEFDCVQGYEVQNMLTLAKVMTEAALTRTESRGAHQRKDYPQRDDERWLRHLTYCIDSFE